MKLIFILLLLTCTTLTKAQDHSTFKSYVVPYIKLGSGYTFNYIKTTKPNVLSYNKTYTPAMAASIEGGVELYFKKWLCATVGVNANFNSFKKKYGILNYKNASVGGQYLYSPVTNDVFIRNFYFELPLGIGTNFNGFKTNITLAPTALFYYYDALGFTKINYLRNGLKLNSALSVEYVFGFKKIGLGLFLQQSYMLNSLQLNYQQNYVLKIHPAVTTAGISIYINAGVPAAATK